MKLAIIDTTGKKTGEFSLDLEADIRDDIFKKAVLSEQSLFRQEKGADPMAGKRQVISLSKRRKAFRTTYGRGGSRTPKKVMWARGTQHRFVGAFAPNTIGGRKAHAPKAQKVLLKDINNKEWLSAVKSGLLASFDSELVMLNGQRVPANYPFVLDAKVEKLSKTREVENFFDKLGLKEEMQRAQMRSVRAGRGTMRNRTYKERRGPLVVISSIESPLFKAARNIKGFDIITSDLLMASDFGMSVNPGRIVLFTKEALTEFVEVLK